MTSKVKIAPWWVSLILTGFALFQQWMIQTGDIRETTNGEAISILLDALRECQMK